MVSISFLGLLVILLILFGVIVIPLLFAGGKKTPEGSESSSKDSGFPVGIVAILLLGLLTVGYICFWYLRPTPPPLRPLQPPIAPPQAVEPPPPVVTAIPEESAEKEPSGMAINESDGQTGKEGRVALFLSVPAESGEVSGSEQSLNLDIFNATQRPVSPASLQKTAENMAWYVNTGKTSYDSVFWDEKEFQKAIPPGKSETFHIRIPLDTVGAKPGSSVRIEFLSSPDQLKATIQSNPVTIPVTPKASHP